MPTPYYCGKTSVLIKRFTFHAVKVTFFVNTEVFGGKKNVIFVSVLFFSVQQTFEKPPRAGLGRLPYMNLCWPYRSTDLISVIRVLGCGSALTDLGGFKYSLALLASTLEV